MEEAEGSGALSTDGALRGGTEEALKLPVSCSGLGQEAEMWTSLEVANGYCLFSLVGDMKSWKESVKEMKVGDSSSVVGISGS